MENLRIHFAHRQQADWPLATGVHRLVREASGGLGLGDAVQGVLLAQFCVDKRGLWLQVASGVPGGIHVNGRPVQRMALLRAGDAVYADGVEMLIRGEASGAATVAPADADADDHDPRIVLRGVGGSHHGRSFTLAGSRIVGSAPEADIRLDSPALPERLAELRRHGERVTLHGLDPAHGIMVNGLEVRDAVLGAGDQVAFDRQSRFVLEVPWGRGSSVGQGAGEEAAGDAVEPAPADAVRRPSVKRWPWLLLAALLLAGALGALLLFGAG